MNRSRWCPWRLLAAGVIAACSTEPAGPSRAPAPVVDASTARANPHNAISALVWVRARHADSVAVSYRVAGGSFAPESLTPAVRVMGDSTLVPVLGLLPDAAYAMKAVAIGPGGTVEGAPLSFTTDPLPSDLPRFTASGSAPEPGFVVFSSGIYALVIDNSGRVVWYRRFADGAGLAFMAQPNGRFTARPPTPQPGDIEPWVELDPTGAVTRTLGCGYGLQPRLHDLIALADGSYWLMCDETRTVDLTSTGGVAGARVTGTVVQHIRADGLTLMHWSPFDHFAITDLDLAERTGPAVNWTHGNAIDLDRDGSLIVSFRSLREVTKIDPETGGVVWRMGGRANQFSFVGTPMPAFSGQHGARILAGGALLLLDNIGNPLESRAERYLVDEGSHTARLAQSYGSAPGVVTLIGGSVQPLAGGHTLVSFGTAGRVEEYDEGGRVVWHLTGSPGYVFRAQRIRSLYAPGVGTPR